MITLSPSHRLPTWRLLMFVLLCVGIITVSGASAVGEFVVSIGVYAIIIQVFATLWRWLRRKRPPVAPWHERLARTCLSLASSFFVVSVLFGLFIVWANYINPIALPRTTLVLDIGTSTGSSSLSGGVARRVVFQSMSHIATPEFYTEVEGTIRSSVRTNQSWLAYE
jgi:small-conductance mechanosensitive channel